MDILILEDSGGRNNCRDKRTEYPNCGTESVDACMGLSGYKSLLFCGLDLHGLADPGLIVLSGISLVQRNFK